MGFYVMGQKCFVETFVQGSTFVLRINSGAKNTPQRKALPLPSGLNNKNGVINSKIIRCAAVGLGAGRCGVLIYLCKKLT